MKNKKATILLILVFLTGLSLLLYPTVSNYWNSFHQSRVIAGYVDAVAELDDVSYGQYLADAQAYNDTLLSKQNRFQPTGEDHALYENLLNITGNGIMGYIEIPVIGVSLPIYHGVDDAILQVAAGHIEGSSLPVGGLGTHCVISGHRGLTSARLFTDLDQLKEGDCFILRVLDETLTYEVDKIRIVEPQETELLEIEKGQDLCTLVTCTPYGINTHRLLVRGHRIENQENVSSDRVVADAVQIEPVRIALLVAVPILLFLIILMIARSSKKKSGKKKHK